MGRQALLLGKQLNVFVNPQKLLPGIGNDAGLLHKIVHV